MKVFKMFKKIGSGLWWFTRGVGRLVAYALAGFCTLIAAGGYFSIEDDKSNLFYAIIWTILALVFFALSEGWFGFQRKDTKDKKNLHGRKETNAPDFPQD